MPSRHLIVLALVAAVAALPAPAGAAPGDCRLIRGANTPTDPTDDVQICRQDNWFHAGGARLANAATTALPSWNTTAPTGAFGPGAGAAYVTTSAFHQGVAPFDTRGTPTFEGTFTGNIDNIAVEMFVSLPARTAAAAHAVAFRLTIDGEELYLSSAADRPALADTAMAGVRKIRFAFRNVHAAMEAAQVDDPTKQHTVRLAIAPWFLVDDNGAFLFDAAEVPSGIIFNLEQNLLGSYTPFQLT